MKESERNYLYLILLHIAIGICIYSFPFTSKIYGYLIIIGGTYFIVNSQNKNSEVLYASAYIIGSEIILRMTSGNPLYEFSKYGVSFYLLLGIYYSGASKNAGAYWIFLFLLLPGVFIATYSLDFTRDLQNIISFNISGSVCLVICSLYCYQRRISFKQINEILLIVGLPIISCTMYLALYTPNIKEVLTGTGSSFATSGGFGPNQVSTILGLGMFIFISRLVYYSPTKMLFLINSIVVLNISFRGLVTFSRGGMITGFLMLILLIIVTYFQINSKAKVKMNYLLMVVFSGMVALWFYSSNETGGLIDKRYANQDAAGRVKEDRFTGREEIAKEELNAFLENPVFGVGVGKTVELRKDKTGNLILSHNEITRLLAEHGSFGIVCLLILFITPLILYLDNKQNVFVLCFLLFWLLTINHAAMRLAAPAFIYSLSLLKVVLINNEKDILMNENQNRVSL